jgi:hypothetical protein
MGTQMSRRFVIVLGEQHEVSVTRLSRTMYRAVGEYRGQTIETTDATPLTTLKRWKGAAQLRSRMSFLVARREYLGLPKDEHQ